MRCLGMFETEKKTNLIPSGKHTPWSAISGAPKDWAPKMDLPLLMYDGSCGPENGNLNFWASSLKSIKMLPKIHWLGQVPMLVRMFFQFPLASRGLPRYSRACGPSSSKEFITRLPGYWGFHAHSRFPTKTSQNINNLLCIRTLRNKRTHYTGFACSKYGLSHYQSEQQCDDLFLNIWSLPPTIAAQSQTIKFIVPWICPFMFNGLRTSIQLHPTATRLHHKAINWIKIHNCWLNLAKWNNGFAAGRINTITTISTNIKTRFFDESNMIKHQPKKRGHHLTGESTRVLPPRDGLTMSRFMDLWNRIMGGDVWCIEVSHVSYEHIRRKLYVAKFWNIWNGQVDMSSQCWKV